MADSADYEAHADMFESLEAAFESYVSAKAMTSDKLVAFMLFSTSMMRHIAGVKRMPVSVARLELLRFAPHVSTAADGKCTVLNAPRTDVSNWLCAAIDEMNGMVMEVTDACTMIRIFSDALCSVKFRTLGRLERSFRRMRSGMTLEIISLNHPPSP
jgi:hypothetical protein